MLNEGLSLSSLTASDRVGQKGRDETHSARTLTIPMRAYRDGAEMHQQMADEL